MDLSPLAVARQVSHLISDAGILVDSSDGYGLKDGRRTEAWQADSARVVVVASSTKKMMRAISDRLAGAGADSVAVFAGIGTTAMVQQLSFLVTDETAPAVMAADLRDLRQQPDYPCQICGGPSKPGIKTCGRVCGGKLARQTREARNESST